MNSKIKSLALLIAFIGFLMFLASCNKTNEVIPPADPYSQDNTSLPTTINVNPDSPISEGDASVHLPQLNANKTEAGAYISSITSSDGNFSVTSTFAGYANIDYDGQTNLTISGSGFGTTRGSLTLTGVTSYTLEGITLWNDTRIQVRIKSGLNSVAAPSSSNNNVTPVITVRNSSGSTYAKGLKLVPTITTKAFQQCTWWAQKRRAEGGRRIQARGQAYSNYSGSVNAYYIPTAGDILIWHNQHEAYIESVQTSSQRFNGYSIYNYTINISEYNVKPEKLSYFTNYVSIKVFDNGSRSIISGSFRSNLSSSVTNFFR